MAEKGYPYQSGFCSAGLHEGTRPKGFMSGTPMKVCVDIERCSCRCHRELDKLFEMTGMDRIPQENPEYSPPERTWWMPSPEDRVASFIAAAPTPTRLIESPAPALVPVTIERSYAPNPSGRAGRGQLESWVKRACDDWILEMPEDRCTPRWLSARIAELEGVKEPSQGAIDSVLKRWVEIGFATMGTKPTRFTGYTVEGVKHGLEVMKLRMKSDKGRQLAAANRGEKR